MSWQDFSVAIGNGHEERIQVATKSFNVPTEVVWTGGESRSRHKILGCDRE